MAWLPKSCVVVPIDYSESSQGAIITALEFVTDPSHVHVMHVLLPARDRDQLAEWAVSPEGEAWDDVGRAYLADFLQRHNVASVTQAVRLGDPGFAITDYARDNHADLIVIPSHGYHGLKRLLLGSVAERVIRYAGCPVLVLRRSAAD